MTDISSCFKINKHFAKISPPNLKKKAKGRLDTRISLTIPNPNKTYSSYLSTAETLHTLSGKKRLSQKRNQKIPNESRFYTTTSNVNEMILKVNENKKSIEEEEKRINNEKILEKEKKLSEKKDFLRYQSNFEKESKIKLEKMRKLKLKIFNLLSSNTHLVCGDFERKNFVFNMKLYDFFSGAYWLNQAKKYHSQFRFGRTFNGEGHDRQAMLIDINNLKKDEIISDQTLGKYLTAEEKKMINEDPGYFLKNSKYKKSNIFKTLTLSKRIDKEDFEKVHTNVVDTEFDVFSRKFKRGMQKRGSVNPFNEKIQAEDVEDKMDKINENIKRQIYDNTSRKLVQKHEETPKEFCEKIMREMTFEKHCKIAEVRAKKEGIDKSKKYLPDDKPQDYRQVQFKFQYMMNKKKRGSILLRPMDALDEMQPQKLNKDELKNLFSLKKFTMEERDVVNKVNRVIKNECYVKDKQLYNKGRALSIDGF